MTKTITGSCLCGGIRFRVESALEPIQICHCGQCRKAQGTPFATNTPVPERAFHWEAGRELLAEYESSPGKKRCFCKVCGSPIYSYRQALPGILRLRAGLFDAPVEATLEAHFHTASKAGWWPIADDLPQHPG